MKYTETLTRIGDIIATERDELKRAVAFLGGSCTFEEKLGPSVCILPVDSNELTTVEVHRIWTDKEGGLHLSGRRLDSDHEDPVYAGPEQEEDLVTVFPGELWQITAKIDSLHPELPDLVRDVQTDPEIVLELTQSSYHVLYALGIKGVELATEIMDRAKELSLKYRKTDWQEEDFWLTMEKETDDFIVDACRENGIGNITIINQ